MPYTKLMCVAQWDNRYIYPCNFHLDQDVEHFCNPRTFLRIPYLSTLFPLHPLKEISIFMPIDHIGLF